MIVLKFFPTCIWSLTTLKIYNVTVEGPNLLPLVMKTKTKQADHCFELPLVHSAKEATLKEQVRKALDLDYTTIM